MAEQAQISQKRYIARHWFVLCLFVLAACGLGSRVIQLQLFDRDFLQNRADQLHLRTVSVPAHRGVITDRHGEPLAISTPVITIACNPQVMIKDMNRVPELANVLELDADELQALIKKRAAREFIYLRRQVSPELAEQVRALGIKGVIEKKEYRRFYPAADVAAHVIGFTNIDDQGQEGVELAYNSVLEGKNGAKKILRDLAGHTIENVESVRAAVPGQDLALSIDKQIQYLAYRELTAAVLGHKARSGSVVVMDAKTGEILAMVNQPSYNPNNRSDLKGDHYRNRAVTDLFEPGSTIKPFTVATALEAGIVQPDTMVDTRPGWMRVGKFTVRDVHNYGQLDVSDVIRKSSNIGVSKLALDMEPELLYKTFQRVGYGTTSGVGFPGEAAGRMSDYSHWRRIEHATLSFGYGMSMTTLQLAQSYTVLANKGVLATPSLLKVDGAIDSERVLSEKTADQVLAMMESVVSNGTGKQAQIPGYRVAGKTGTVHKSNEGGYAENRYVSLFAGIVPVSNPRLVAAVIISEPTQGEYYGGQVAAPVFGRLMGETLRLMNISPDAIPAEDKDAKKAVLMAGGEH